MNKKTIGLIIVALIVLILVINKNNSIQIPKDAIRIRVIANSQAEVDQKLKKKVLESVEKELYNLLKDVKNTTEARKIIQDNMERLNISILDSTDEKYKINYGKNYFPKKVYKGVIYDEGEYESLVITLGNGEGNNFWCVLFPPLCLLEGNKETEDVTYQFFVKEMLEKYF